MIWLLLSITSFTTDGQITKRDLFVPFATHQACEAAQAGIVTSKQTNIGIDADLGICIVASENFEAGTTAWPLADTWDEKKERERRRLADLKAEAEEFKRKYDATHR